MSAYIEGSTQHATSCLLAALHSGSRSMPAGMPVLLHKYSMPTACRLRSCPGAPAVGHNLAQPALAATVAAALAAVMRRRDHALHPLDVILPQAVDALLVNNGCG